MYYCNFKPLTIWGHYEFNSCIVWMVSNDDVQGTIRLIQIYQKVYAGWLMSTHRRSIILSCHYFLHLFLMEVSVYSNLIRREVSCFDPREGSPLKGRLVILSPQGTHKGSSKHVNFCVLVRRYSYVGTALVLDLHASDTMFT